jgi:predicted DNA-binding protein (UPF0251 family)
MKALPVKNVLNGLSYVRQQRGHMPVDELADELAELNQIRLDDDLTWDELGEQVGVDGPTLHRLVKQPDRKAFDRTMHKIRRFLESHRDKPSRRRRSVAREARVSS